MMRMGDHVIAEWTHSGKVRFITKEPTRMHRHSTKGPQWDELPGRSEKRSPDFFKIHNKGWQRDVRRYIERNIGIRL